MFSSIHYLSIKYHLCYIWFKLSGLYNRPFDFSSIDVVTANLIFPVKISAVKYLACVMYLSVAYKAPQVPTTKF